MFLVLSFERFINYELLIMISCSFIGNGKLVVIKFKSIVVGWDGDKYFWICIVVRN